MSDRPTPQELAESHAMSDTPETDALVPSQGRIRTMREYIDELEAHARRLERQRDDWYGAFLLATKRAGDAGERLVEMKRQRDELMDALTVIKTIASYPHHPNALHAIQSIAKNTIAAVKGGDQ